MSQQLINYETILKVTQAMSMSNDPKEVVQLTVKSIQEALEMKGCAIFLVNPKSNDLEVAAAYGLSDKYLHKGPLSALKSIANALKDGPVAIYDVGDDPRIQYPEAALEEGIASMLSVPIYVGGNAIGALRVYSAKPLEFSLEDVGFVQALAQMAGMLINMCRLYQGQKEYIDVLTTFRGSWDL